MFFCAHNNLHIPQLHPFNFLKYCPFSNVPVPEGLAGTACVPSKQEEKMYFLPLKCSISHYPPGHPNPTFSLSGQSVSQSVSPGPQSVVNSQSPASEDRSHCAWKQLKRIPTIRNCYQEMNSEEMAIICSCSYF
jgi:hypothetical protein